jgi:hypothetical protein
MIWTETVLPCTIRVIEFAETYDEYLAGWLALREGWSEVKICDPRLEVVDEDDEDFEEVTLRAVQGRDICT